MPNSQGGAVVEGRTGRFGWRGAPSGRVPRRGGPLGFLSALALLGASFGVALGAAVVAPQAAGAAGRHP